MAQLVCVVVGDADRKQLSSIAADRNRPQKHIQRALIVLRSSEALTVAEVARQAGEPPGGLALAGVLCRS
jgi:hypothetical protein